MTHWSSIRVFSLLFIISSALSAFPIALYSQNAVKALESTIPPPRVSTPPFAIKPPTPPSTGSPAPLGYPPYLSLGHPHSSKLTAGTAGTKPKFPQIYYDPSKTSREEIVQMAQHISSPVELIRVSKISGQDLKQITQQTTVPQIFAGSKQIGGRSDMVGLGEEGLKSMLIDQFMDGQQPHIRIFTREGCTHCIQAKKWLRERGFGKLIKEYEVGMVSRHTLKKVLGDMPLPVVFENNQFKPLLGAPQLPGSKLP